MPLAIRRVLSAPALHSANAPALIRRTEQSRTFSLCIARLFSPRCQPRAPRVPSSTQARSSVVPLCRCGTLRSRGALARRLAPLCKYVPVDPGIGAPTHCSDDAALLTALLSALTPPMDACAPRCCLAGAAKLCGAFDTLMQPAPRVPRFPQEHSLDVLRKCDLVPQLPLHAGTLSIPFSTGNCWRRNVMKPLSLTVHAKPQNCTRPQRGLAHLSHASHAPPGLESLQAERSCALARRTPPAVTLRQPELRRNLPRAQGALLQPCVPEE